MNIENLMTKNPATCSRNTSLEEVAKLMTDHDCGMIPVVETNGTTSILGTVTDRDIACRAVARGKNPLELSAGDIMTDSAITLKASASREDAENLMEQHQIRRLLIVDNNDSLVGILAQADLAQAAPPQETGKMVEEISEKDGSALNR